MKEYIKPVLLEEEYNFEDVILSSGFAATETGVGDTVGFGDIDWRV